MIYQRYLHQEFWANMKDLLVIVSDKNIEFLLLGLFSRLSRIENIKNFTYQIMVHPQRDPGVVNDSHNFARSFSSKFNYIITVSDYEGSGKDDLPLPQIKQIVETNLESNGWASRACSIIVSPEIENWIWVNEAQMHDAVSWNQTEGIYEWIDKNKLRKPGEFKPFSPKEAFEKCLRICQTARSSSIYKKIGSSASYKNCTDTSFLMLITQLKEWFKLENQ